MKDKRTVVMRGAMFETNSSSMHTFILTNFSDYTTDAEIKKYLSEFSKEELCVDDNGNFYLPLTEDYTRKSTTYEDTYGQEFAIYDSWIDKLRYCAASLNVGSVHSLISAIQKRLPKCKGLIASFESLSYDMDEEESLSPSTPYYPEYMDNPFGNVDHQSLDNVLTAINSMSNVEKYKDMDFVEKMYEIIFSNKIVIITDSDCSSTLSHYIAENIIDSSKIEMVLSYADDDSDEEKYTYKFISTEEYLKQYDET